MSRCDVCGEERETTVYADPDDDNETVTLCDECREDLA